MSAEEHLGDSTEWDLLVQRIREMPDDDRDRELYEARKAGRVEGWADACRYLESELRQNKRAYGRRLEDRIYREYRRWQRRFVLEFVYFAAIAFVMAGALIYISRGPS